MTDILEGDVASGHTSSRMTTRIEVVSRLSGRRRWTVEQKLGILRDAFGPGGSVRAAMERHDIGSGPIYVWRRQAMSGELTGVRPAALSVTGPAFAEVEISEPVIATAPAPSAPQHCGQIGIELLSGVRLRVDSAFDADALARIIAVLGQ